jgi:hypothetical protein
MDGDLKGLQRMKKWEREGNGMTADQQRAEILRLLLALPPAKQKAALEWIKLEAEISHNA